MNARPLTREVSLESTEIEREERGEGWEIREAFKPWRIIEYSKLMKLESHVKLLCLLQSYIYSLRRGQKGKVDASIYIYV